METPHARGRTGAKSGQRPIVCPGRTGLQHGDQQPDRDQLRTKQGSDRDDRLGKTSMETTIFWTVIGTGAVITGVLLTVATLLNQAINARFNDMGTRFDDLRNHMDKRLDDQNKLIAGRFEDHNRRLDDTNRHLESVAAEMRQPAGGTRAAG